MKRQGNGRRVVVLPYNPGWPAMYERERQTVSAATAALPCVLDIQHIGSTSVPGLAAKPVIDIAVGVTSFDDARDCIAPLESLGYEYRGECGIPRRHFFSRDNARENDPGLRRTHHVHVLETAGEDWKRHILFRDALRADAGLVRQYARLKQALAQIHRDDTEAYCTAKTDFILGVVRRCTEQHRSRNLPSAAL